MFELDKEKIIICMANKDYMDKKINLKKIAHSYFLDMLVVYRQIIGQNEEGITTRTILLSELKENSITLKELDEIAKKNSLRLFPPTTNYYYGMPYVTNNVGFLGSSVIIYSDIIERIADNMNSDVFILPSSIHEVIVIPSNKNDAEYIKSIVKETNEMFVNPKDILSNNIYIYERKNKKIEMVSTTQS